MLASRCAAECAEEKRCLTRSDELLLAFLGLREGEASIPPHPLRRSNLLDGLLELLHSRAIVWQVECLDLLHNVIRLRHEKPFVGLPTEISQEEEDGQEKHGEPHDGGPENAAHHVLVL